MHSGSGGEFMADVWLASAAEPIALQDVGLHLINHVVLSEWLIITPKITHWNISKRFSNVFLFHSLQLPLSPLSFEQISKSECDVVSEKKKKNLMLIANWKIRKSIRG